MDTKSKSRSSSKIEEPSSMKTKPSPDSSCEDLAEKLKQINLDEKSSVKKSASPVTTKPANNVPLGGTITVSKKQSEQEEETDEEDQVSKVPVEVRGPVNGTPSCQQHQDQFSQIPYYRQHHGATKRGNVHDYHDASKYNLLNQSSDNLDFLLNDQALSSSGTIYQSNLTGHWNTNYNTQPPNFQQRRESTSPSYDPNSPSGSSDSHAMFSPASEYPTYTSLPHQSVSYDANVNGSVSAFPTHPTPPYYNQYGNTGMMSPEASYSGFNSGLPHNFGVQSPSERFLPPGSYDYQIPASYPNNPSPASSHTTYYSGGVPSPYDSSDQSLYGNGNSNSCKELDNIPSLPELGYNSIQEVFGLPRQSTQITSPQGNGMTQTQLSNGQQYNGTTIPVTTIQGLPVTTNGAAITTQPSLFILQDGKLVVPGSNGTHPVVVLVTQLPAQKPPQKILPKLDPSNSSTTTTPGTAPGKKTTVKAKKTPKGKDSEEKAIKKIRSDLEKKTDAELLMHLSNGETILTNALKEKKHQFISALILEMQPRPALRDLMHTANKDTQTPLYVAITCGMDIWVQTIIKSFHPESNTMISVKQPDGNMEVGTVLHTIAKNGKKYEKFLEPLFTSSKPPAVEIANSYGMTPLQLAIYHHRPENDSTYIIKFLLSRQAKSTTQDNTNGRTALHLAVEKGDIDIIKILLENNSTSNLIEAKNYEDRTALHLAAANCYLSPDKKYEICKLLLEKGARKGQKDRKKMTPKDLCPQQEQQLRQLLDVEYNMSPTHQFVI